MSNVADDLRGRAQRLREMAAEREHARRPHVAQTLHRAAAKLLEAADAVEAAKKEMREAREAVDEAFGRVLDAADRAREAAEEARADGDAPRVGPS